VNSPTFNALRSSIKIRRLLAWQPLAQRWTWSKDGSPGVERHTWLARVKVDDHIAGMAPVTALHLREPEPAARASRHSIRSSLLVRCAGITVSRAWTQIEPWVVRRKVVCQRAGRAGEGRSCWQATVPKHMVCGAVAEPGQRIFAGAGNMPLCLPSLLYVACSAWERSRRSGTFQALVTTMHGTPNL